LRGAITDAVSGDVIHTPIIGVDDAHTDFITHNSNKGDLDEIITWLQDRLTVSPPGTPHPFAAQQFQRMSRHLVEET
jgi:hypothetical protein